jgi:hypothetical protein
LLKNSVGETPTAATETVAVPKHGNYATNLPDTTLKRRGKAREEDFVIFILLSNMRGGIVVFHERKTGWLAGSVGFGRKGNS